MQNDAIGNAKKQFAQWKYIPVVFLQRTAAGPSAYSGGVTMSDNNKQNDSKPRRDFLFKSLAGAAGAAVLPLSGAAATPAAAAAPAPANDGPPGYQWLKPDEQAFVEALVEHMCPADKLSAGGVDLGLNIYFDRALAGNWGQGDRLYLQGPFKPGTPNQGYQLGMTPAQLFRVGGEGLAAYCLATYQKP